MNIDKNSVVDDIVVACVEELANIFFSDEEKIIEQIISGEHDTSIVDMSLNYDVFRLILEEAYGISEEEFIDSAADLLNVSIFIDKMKREIFEVIGVNIMVDPYGDIVVIFDMHNLIEG